MESLKLENPSKIESNPQPSPANHVPEGQLFTRILDCHHSLGKSHIPDSKHLFEELQTQHIQGNSGKGLNTARSFPC